MRKTYLWCSERKAWVDKNEIRRERVMGPMIIGDSMDPVVHPSDGKMYDSKSAFRAVTKAHGMEEVGNEKRAFFEGGTETRGDFNCREELTRATREVLSRHGRRNS